MKTPDWDERLVVYRWPDGWTLERVGTEHDMELEGTLLKNCFRDPKSWPLELTDSRFDCDCELLSLRDPRGRPHAGIALEDGVLVELAGKANGRLKWEYAERIMSWAAENTRPRSMFQGRTSGATMPPMMVQGTQ
jgi:hypothetical protein